MSKELRVWMIFIVAVFEVIHIAIFYIVRNYLGAIMGWLLLIILICITLIFYIECRKESKKEKKENENSSYIH